MNPTTKLRRDATINVRLPAATRDLIDSAAEMIGKTRSEFILESARQHAADVLLDRRLFSLSEEAFGAFAKALDEPPPAPDSLKALMASRSPWDS